MTRAPFWLFLLGIATSCVLRPIDEGPNLACDEAHPCTKGRVCVARQCLAPDNEVVVSATLGVQGSAQALTGMPELELRAQWGAGMYLVVWKGTTPMGPRVMGMRLSAAGERLDERPFVIATGRAESAEPDVAFDGTNFFVVWQGTNILGSYSQGIHGARVRPDGTVLDRPALELVRADDAWAPKLAFNGSQYLVTWEEGAGPRKVMARLVLPDGSLRNPISVSAGAGSRRNLSVAAQNADFVVVWSVWFDAQRGLAAPIYGTRIKEGVVVEPNGVLLTADAGTQPSPTVACGPTECLVAWSDGVSVGAGRYSSPDAGTIDIAVNGAPTAPGVDFDGAQFSVSWTTQAAQSLTIRKVDSQGSVSNASVVRSAGVAPQAHALVWNGQQHLVVWGDSVVRSGRGARFSKNLDALDTTSREVTRPSGALSAQGQQTAAAVGFDGTSAVVAWIENGVATAGRLSRGGALVDANGLIVSSQATAADPGVTGYKGSVLISWTQLASNLRRSYVRRLREGVLGTEALLYSAGTRTEETSFVVRGDDLIAVFQSLEGNFKVQARRVDASGAGLGASFPIAAADATLPFRQL